MLFGVERFDPLVLAAVTITTLFVAAAGALIPERRAAAVDPIMVLRLEN